MTRQRVTLAMAAGFVLTAVAVTTVIVAPEQPEATQPRDAIQVDLAGIVAQWPESYTVQGTKSEPLYTELIEVTRVGNTFTARIDVVSQGDAALGTQLNTVEVTSAASSDASPDASVHWVQGCVKDATTCADDPAVRGFLATSALVALAQRDALPAAGTVRTLHGTEVVCVEDGEVFPDAPAAIVPLSPCFDVQTGAVLGHWSAASAAFVGATLAAGFAVEEAPD